MVGRATNPRALSPALEASMTSPAACRAMASAIGLRQELPRHRNNTFTRLGSDLIIALQTTDYHWVLAVKRLSGRNDFACRAAIGAHRFRGPYHPEEFRMHGGVFGKLRMKRSSHQPSAAHQDRMPFRLREHFHARPHALDNRRADKHHLERFFF